MKVEVKSRGRSGRSFGEFDVETLEELQKEFHKRHRKYYPSRQKYSLNNPASRKEKAINVDANRPLKDQLDEQHVLYFKDLGMQVGWTTVFFWEYFVPMISFPLLYILRPYIYSAELRELSRTQIMAAVLFTLHFVKREVETFKVHVFSKGTMPVFNIFKNSSYYWAFALLIAYSGLHPLYTNPNELQSMIFGVLFVVFEISNLKCHLILGSIRKKDPKKRDIPRGFMFEYVTCANYLFEILAWISFTFMTQVLWAAIFTLVGALQMKAWAVGKHKKLKAEFGSKYPKNRKILIPFVY